MSDLYTLFPARVRFVDQNGHLSPEAIKAFFHLTRILGGSGGSIPSALTISLDDGTLSAPSLNFLNETDLGIRRVSSGILAIVDGGADIVRFSSLGVLISGLTASSFLYNNAAGRIATTSAPTDGQLLIGSTGAIPVVSTLTGTANRVTVTNGAGSITLSGPQDIHIAATPTFAALTISGLTANAFLYSGVGGLLTSTAAPTNGQLLIGSTGVAPVVGAITGTANRVIVTLGAGTIALTGPQDIHTGASPTFVVITLSGLTANSFLYSGAGGLLTTTTAPTNGQLLIGSTGVAPVAATLTGTANRVTVTNGAGSITLSAPQDIHTAASPTFAGLTVSGLTARSFMYSGAASALSSTTAPTNGQILIGSTGADPVVASITGTSNQVTVTGGAGSITLSTPQDIHTGASPTFVGATLSGATASSFSYFNGSKAVSSTAAPTNGQLLVGSTGSNPAVAALTGTSNQVTVTNGAGSITLSTPQDIHTSATPTFGATTLNGDLTLNTAGNGLNIKEGSNASMGVATLVGGTVTVSNTLVTANSRIFLTGQNSSGTAAELTISARVASTSFTITSALAADTRDIAWWIVEPA